MSFSRLKDEMQKAIPFQIEYNFEKAYIDFRKTHSQVSELLFKKWRNAFELAARGELERASHAFERLNRDLNGHSFSALFNCAMCHLLDGRIADASICFSKAESIFQNDYWLHIYGGITDFALGLISCANRHWWAALRIKEDDLVLKLLQRFLLDEHHPERMALYPLCQGRGIDVGCGHRKTHPDAIGVDLVAKGESPATDGDGTDLKSQADIVSSGDDLNVFENESLDYVVQRHNLEHYQDPIKALQEWIRVLKPGGILGMVVPDDEVVDTIRMDKTHKHAFTQSSLRRILDLLADVRVIYSAPLIFRYSFVCVAQKVDQRQGATFDYLACINRQQICEIQNRIDLYAKGGMHGLESQCRRYLHLNRVHKPSIQLNAILENGPPDIQNKAIYAHI
jgi:SAM-dependent methyltransferase